MNRRRIWAVVFKEWADVRKNKIIVFSTIFLPILLVGMIFYVAHSFTSMSPEKSGDMGSLTPEAIKYMAARNQGLVVMLDQFLYYLLLVPGIIPALITSNSIILEKETKSLEPVLATPITTGELLLGKILAAVIPAVVVFWLSYGICAIGLYFMIPAEPFSYFTRLAWLVMVVLHAPLLGVLAGLLGVMVSSRVKDVRTAQQLSGLVVLPIIGLGSGFLFTKKLIDPLIVSFIGIGLLIIDIIILRLAVAVFQREKILTGWK